MRRFLSRFLVLLGALVVWDLAVVSWIGDGMEDLSPSERAAAEEALADLSITCLDNPLQGAFTRHKHVAVVTGPVPCYDDSPLTGMRADLIGRAHAGRPARTGMW